jgi:diguanylate cyclase (GGDEF)-like protein
MTIGLQSRRRAVFDAGVSLLALVVVARAIVDAFRPVDPLFGSIASGLVLCAVAVPITAMLCRHAVQLVNLGGAIRVATDSAVLVMLSLVVPLPWALLTWLAGVAVSEMRRESPAVRFNLSLSALAGTALLVAISQIGTTTPGIDRRDLLALLVGSASYVAIDLVLTAIRVGSFEGDALRSLLLDETVPLASLAVLSMNAIGMLAATLLRTDPEAVVLIVAAGAVITLAVRQGETATTERARSTALVDAAAACHDADSASDVLDAVVGAGRTVAGSPLVEVVDRPPGAGEVGAPWGVGVDRQWLIAHPRPAGHVYRSGDERGLQVLAALAEQALARVAESDRMRTAATVDPLTGLANRRGWINAFDQVIAISDAALASDPPSQENNRNTTLVFFCDLDGFKTINDTLGHNAGDVMLNAVASRIRAAVRADDVVGRYGGDEFVVLVRDADPSIASVLAKRITAEVARPLDIAGVVVRPSISVGVSDREPGATATETVEAADKAMYEVKRMRGSQLVLVPTA